SHHRCRNTLLVARFTQRPPRGLSRHQARRYAHLDSRSLQGGEYVDRPTSRTTIRKDRLAALDRRGTSRTSRQRRLFRHSDQPEGRYGLDVRQRQKASRQLLNMRARRSASGSLRFVKERESRSSNSEEVPSTVSELCYCLLRRLS